MNRVKHRYPRLRAGPGISLRPLAATRILSTQNSAENWHRHRPDWPQRRKQPRQRSGSGRR
eukprot:10018685-Alexandrium_andersonii.AAC.1